MRIVITGGAGFIGSHLCEFFLKRGDEVVCVDNFITGSQKNIAPFSKYPNFTLITHDVTKYFEVPGKVDWILHFASPASPMDYQKLPIQTLKVGALGTHNALGIAKVKKAGFLLASSSEVYGDPLVHPQDESYWGNVNPTGPRGVYDEAKRFAEALTMAYHRIHKIEVRIARIFNTYGERMRKDDGRVVPNFIIQALKGKPLTIYGDGTQTRSFCYITDLVKGIWKLINSKINTPINLGNPTELSIIEFAKLVIKLTKSKSKMKHYPLPINDPKIRCPDISLAKKELKWSSTVSLEEGIMRTIEYFKEII
jgi:dTDP-glucose 4,6-dehydratase